MTETVEAFGAKRAGKPKWTGAWASTEARDFGRAASVAILGLLLSGHLRPPFLYSPSTPRSIILQANILSHPARAPPDEGCRGRRKSGRDAIVACGAPPLPPSCPTPSECARGGAR